MLFWILALLLALTGLFFGLTGRDGPLLGLEGGELATLIVGGILIFLYAVSLSDDYRGRAKSAIGHALIWIGLIAALVVGYAFRDDLARVTSKVAGELLPPGRALPSEPGEAGERAVRLRKHPEGHFMAQADVNGVAVRMLVDTGASNVVLRQADAETIGIDTASLVYSVPVRTANGETFCAPLRLKTISVGAIALENVEALVAKPGSLNESLLGMSFLKRLRSYEFTGDFLTLRG